MLFSIRPAVLVALVTASVGTGPVALAQSAAGIRWTTPAGWTVEAARPMRAATYTIAGGNTGAAECIVSYFGPGQGGTVEANVDRWKGQMLGPGGKPAAASVASRVVRGVTITVIDASGTYTGMGGPMAAAAAAKPVEGYRLLGAIAEGPGGLVFFKLTGPSATVAAQQSAFDQMIASISPV